MSKVSEDVSEQAKPDQAQSALIARLSSYAVVNSSWNVILGSYNATKNYSPMLKAGLEKAEAAGQYVYSTAEPVVRPVVVSLNDKFALDEKGVQILDKVEHAVEGVKTAAHDAKTKTATVIAEGKQAATHAIESGKQVAATKTHELIATGNRPLNHFLDLAEIVVDKILPPTMPQPRMDTNNGSADSSNGPADSESGEEERRLVANPVTRASALGIDVSKRVRDAAVARLPSITMRSPAEIAEMTHVIDLIQYATQFVDLEAQKARLSSVVQATQTRLNEAKEAIVDAKEATNQKIDEAKGVVAEKVQPIKALIEAHTADLKDSASRSVVALVAAVAHSSEILRRRIGRQSSAVLEHIDAEKRREQLQHRLAEVTEQAKAYVKTLSDVQLRDYMSNVRHQSSAALAALVNLLNQATSTTLAGGLLSWTNSIAARLGYQVVPVTALSAPEIFPVGEEAFEEVSGSGSSDHVM